MLALLGGALALMLLGRADPAVAEGHVRARQRVTAGTAGALAMVQWDDITDNGPTTLVGGRGRLRHVLDVRDDHDLRAVILVSLLTDERCAAPRTTGPRSTPCTSWRRSAAVVMASANDLIVLFLGLETLSLALYVLAASDRRRDRAASRASSTSCSAGSRPRSSSTASRWSTARPDRRTSARSSPTCSGRRPREQRDARAGRDRAAARRPRVQGRRGPFHTWVPTCTRARRPRSRRSWRRSARRPRSPRCCGCS